MKTAREHLGGAVSNRAFYVLAGRTAQTGNLTVVERYVPVQAPLGAASRDLRRGARRHRGHRR